MRKYYFIFTVLTISFSQAQVINIPDVNFKNYLLTALLLDTDNNIIGDSTIDINNNGEIEQNEALLLNELYVNDLNIASLSGIEYFTNLIHLRFNNNQVTTIDLHTLHQLKHIQCFNNQLTEISLCGTPATSLWAEGNPNLTYISVKNNVISQHDVTRGTSENTPPGLPSFMFPESLQILCYDAEEYDAVSFVAPIATLVTDCEADCAFLALAHPEKKSGWRLIPNPACSIVEILGKDPILSVSIFNSFGQLIQQHSSETVKPKIDISNLQLGTYLIEINSNQGKTTQKLIKI